MKNVMNGSIIFLSVTCMGLVYQKNEIMNQNDKAMMISVIIVMSLLAIFSYNKVNISPTLITNKISDLIVSLVTGTFRANTKPDNMVVRARNKRR